MSIILPGQPRRPLQIGVTTLHGHVVIQLSRPMIEITLQPQEAAELSLALAKMTATLTGKKVVPS